MTKPTENDREEAERIMDLLDWSDSKVNVSDLQVVQDAIAQVIATARAEGEKDGSTRVMKAAEKAWNNGERRAEAIVTAVQTEWMLVNTPASRIYLEGQP